MNYARSYTTFDGETHFVGAAEFIPGMPPLDLSAQLQQLCLRGSSLVGMEIITQVLDASLR